MLHTGLTIQLASPLFVSKFVKVIRYKSPEFGFKTRCFVLFFFGLLCSILSFLLLLLNLLLVKDILLGEYIGVDDTWLKVIGSQGLSLLAVDVSSSAISDIGLAFIQQCRNLEILHLNYCDNISDGGLDYLPGYSF